MTAQCRHAREPTEDHSLPCDSSGTWLTTRPGTGDVVVYGQHADDAYVAGQRR